MNKTCSEMKTFHDVLKNPDGNTVKSNIKFHQDIFDLQYSAVVSRIDFMSRDVR